MPGLVIIGAQWGDEGKGKLVDYLTAQATHVVRFHGGNNAGHTLVVNGQKVKLQLVPSGVLRPQTRCLIGAGVVLDPEVFAKEIQGLAALGVNISRDRIMLDHAVQLVLPYHVQVDQAREAKKGDAKIGTTGRGIGPAYEDRAGRAGVRVADLDRLAELKPRLEALVAERNIYLEHVLDSDQRVEFSAVWSVIERAAKLLIPLIGNVSLTLNEALDKNEKVVFEGAQGTLLDVNFGTVPFVTSSHCLAGYASAGSGVGAKYLNYTLGVAKAYCTRVGSGPFPTELMDATGDKIRERGAEFGTVTGRPRRCGWFDVLAIRRAIRLNGLTSLAVTKLDVLSGIPSLKICSGYKLGGKLLEDIPVHLSDFSQVEPQYLELPGWTEDISNVTKLSDLPVTAQRYLAKLEELVGIPVSMISVGAERKATFFNGSADFLKGFC